MVSRTREMLNKDGEFKAREFNCGECGHYELTYISEDVIDCPNCFNVIEPNEDFVLKIVRSLE